MNYKKIIKKILVNLPFFMPVASHFTRNVNPIIFLYHRFCDSQDNSKNKADTDSFEWQLQQISKYFEVVTFGEYVELKRQRKKIPKRLVVLTIDDGYDDFYQYAYPLLKKYKIKATFFVAVNYINRVTWLWPDMIEYMFKRTELQTCDFSFGEKQFDYDLSDDKIRNDALWEIIRYCILIDNKKKWELIKLLESVLNVSIPKEIPEEYAPVSWEQLKEMSENGIEIGSHTMNHPILSKIQAEEIFEEVDISKKEIEKKIGKKITSFCYPNSNHGDINDAVVQQVKASGYTGAVFEGYPDKGDLFRVPRTGSENKKENFLWKLSGMEFLKQ